MLEHSKHQNITEELISRRQAEKILGLAKGTLDVWASTKRYSLPFYKIGRRSMYRRHDLLRFITENQR